jgi:hypothetical protein
LPRHATIEEWSFLTIFFIGGLFDNTVVQVVSSAKNYEISPPPPTYQWCIVMEFFFKSTSTLISYFYAKHNFKYKITVTYCEQRV